MRKKLLSIVSLIVVFVMCFAFIGCNDDETPQGPSKSAEMAAIGRVVDGAGLLLNTSAYKVEVGGEFVNARTFTNVPNANSRSRGFELSVNAEKRDEWIKFVGTETDFIDENRSEDNISGYINLTTGYVYTPYTTYDNDTYEAIVDPSKYEFMDAIPAGVVDNISGSIGSITGKFNNIGSEGLEWLSEFVTSDSNSVTIDFDLKDAFNRFITTITKHYNNNSSVGAFFNEYLSDKYPASGDQTPVGAVIDEIISDINDNKNKTFGDYISILETNLGATLEDLLQSTGESVDAAIIAKLRARKVGDALTALLDLYESGEIATATPDQIMDAVLNKKVSSTANLKSRLTSTIKPLIITLLNGIPVSEMVNALNLTTMVNRNFVFACLDGRARFQFDANGYITGITMSFNVGTSRDYVDYSGSEPLTGRVTETYAGEFSFGLSDIGSNSAASFETEVKPNIAEKAFDNHISALAVVGQNANVYFEKGKQNVTFNTAGATAYYYDDNYYQRIDLDVSGKVSYNASTSTFTVRASLFEQAVAMGAQSIYVTVPVSGVVVEDDYYYEDIDTITINFGLYSPDIMVSL